MGEEGIILVLDYENICRLCLQSKGSLSSLFDENEDDGATILFQILELTSVNIDNGNSLPTKICHKCRCFVEMAYELRNLVIKSDKLLTAATSAYSDSTDNKNTELVRIANEDFKIEMLDETSDEIGSNILQDNKMVDAAVDNLEDVISEEVNFQYLEQRVFKSEIDERKKSADITKDMKNWLPNGQKNIDSSKLFLKQCVPKHLVCQICLMTFKNRTDVKSHALGEHYKNSELKPYFYIEKPFVCCLCQEKFHSKKNLITHHRLHLGVSPYKCDTCGSSFRTKQSLTYHTVVHGDRRHTCATCGASFRRAFELNQHMTRHEDEGTCYPCPSCRVICSNRISYKAHMRHHLLGRRFKCPRTGCPKAYFSQTDLRVHLRAHDNDRCFQCHLCVCSYISQSQLNRHLRQHKKRRVNKCDKCSSTFFDYTAYCNHRINVHGHWHPFKCAGCNQGYQNECHLKNHMKKCTVAQEMLSINDADSEEKSKNEVVVSEKTEESIVDNTKIGQQTNVEENDSQPLILERNEDGTIIPTLLYWKRSEDHSEGDSSDKGTWYTVLQETDP